ncbi:tRNA dihydrouridine synthase DusB [Microbacterium amylolyticum]|uniref:tRNA-dihydrouridine synthase n=1 Tax=Microbacterium amylolyticum TaxID=936337 RepID=A0ABS4ZED2_9MICO|nr:tRNA dihydrouridine synthase DusB [Microbacterium amylolyticum]MBP2435636.1 nifR3 family TIM-barrel protein [Microbacterium amylolyticum]
MTTVTDSPRDSVQRAVPPLRIGPIEVDVPVVLAPMAGITNMAFRRLCREYGAGLYVTEMITTRALVERNVVTMKLIEHHPSETPRSIQLYGVDPTYTAEAARMIAAENLADHIDLNFGCPVPKVTRKGGGSALPWKRDLFGDIVKGAVDAAGDIPVTVKMRKGIDDDHLTFLDAGRIAEDAGVAAVSLHARTLQDAYSGTADWAAIAALKQAVTSVPVLGNGDIWGAEDAIRMMGETGADGVVVGRGCLGRPWLFGELARAFGADAPTVDATLAFVANAFRRHAELLVDFYDDEDRGTRDIRKHASWYFKGYPVGGDLRGEFSKVTSLQHIDDLIGQLDLSEPYPGEAVEGPRGRAGRARRPVLPEGWLASRTLDARQTSDLQDAELDTSGG